MLGYGNNLQDSTYSNTQNALNSGNAYNWDNLNNYASIVNNGAKLGGTSSFNFANQHELPVEWSWWRAGWRSTSWRNWIDGDWCRGWHRITSRLVV